MATDPIIENCPLCDGEGSIDHGDRSNGTYLEAYVVCCECNLPVTRGDYWRQVIAEAMQADRLDVLRSLCHDDLGPDEIAADWNDWKAENLVA